MVGAIGVLSILLGGTLAYAAEQFSAHIKTLETSAGALLIGGLALLGSALPIIL
jgi:hypothetical protein